MTGRLTSSEQLGTDAAAKACFEHDTIAPGHLDREVDAGAEDKVTLLVRAAGSREDMYLHWSS